MQTVDYIVVGQGICGTMLSYYLLQNGAKVLVIDEAKPGSASMIASGIINPVTGRRMVKTWQIETLLPFAWEAYKQVEELLGVKVVQQTEMVDFFTNRQMKEAFEKRVEEDHGYLHLITETGAYDNFFNHYYGAGAIAPCLLIDLHTLLLQWKAHLMRMGCLQVEAFDFKQLQVSPTSVGYKNTAAQKIFFCEGVAGFTNPYFANLPYTHMKGEVIIAAIPGLPRNALYKNGLSIIPWRDDLFWIGSSYEWKFDDLLPTQLFKQKVQRWLDEFLRLPYHIVDHLAADRPANLERRPFVGLHPHHKAVGILNGMGTKGCSLAPYFAHQLCQHVLNGIPIQADANVDRFSKVLTMTDVMPL